MFVASPHVKQLTRHFAHILLSNVIFIIEKIEEILPKSG